jgi:hypothetical protein
MGRVFESKNIIMSFVVALFVGSSVQAKPTAVRKALEPSMSRVEISKSQAPDLYYLELRNHPLAAEDDKVHAVSSSKVSAQEVLEQFFESESQKSFTNLGEGPRAIEDFSKMLNQKTKNTFSKVEDVMMKLVKKGKITQAFWFSFQGYKELTQYLVLVDDDQKVVMIDMDEDSQEED